MREGSEKKGETETKRDFIDVVDDMNDMLGHLVETTKLLVAASRDKSWDNISLVYTTDDMWHRLERLKQLREELQRYCKQGAVNE